MNLIFTLHRKVVTSQFLFGVVQCGNATQLRRSMNGPLVKFELELTIDQEIWLLRNGVNPINLKGESGLFLTPVSCHGAAAILTVMYVGKLLYLWIWSNHS